MSILKSTHTGLERPITREWILSKGYPISKKKSKCIWPAHEQTYYRVPEKNNMYIVVDVNHENTDYWLVVNKLTMDIKTLKEFYSLYSTYKDKKK